MRMRSIFAPSAREALLRARQQFGDDARILTTRATDDGVELIVVEESAPARETELVALRDEVRSLRERLSSFDTNIQPGLEDLHSRLTACGASRELRDVALRAALPHRGTLAFDAASSALARAIPVLPPKAQHPGGPRILAIVGPTGVGKTTTIAKLAGRLVHGAKRRVAFITLDTYRVGAVEQLRAYADLLNAPFEVAFTPADALRAVEKFNNVDVILLDTTGRSPLDAPRVAELTGALGHVDRLEVLLTLSATSSIETLRTIARQFAGLRPTGLVITKLDETHHCGPAFSVAFEQKLPIAFLCNGQDVPGDLERASGERIAAWILRGGAASAARAPLARASA